MLNGQWEVEASRHTAITRAIESVEPAVASISVVQIQDVYNPFTRDPFFDFFFPERSRKREVHSSGSGVVISPDGYVLTNTHVVENASKISVTLSGGDEYDAEVIGVDKTSDLALLLLNGNNFPFLT